MCFSCQAIHLTFNFQKNSCEFCEISKNTFFTENFLATAPELYLFINPFSITKQREKV